MHLYSTICTFIQQEAKRYNVFINGLYHHIFQKIDFIIRKSQYNSLNWFASESRFLVVNQVVLKCKKKKIKIHTLNFINITVNCTGPPICKPYNKT